MENARDSVISSCFSETVKFSSSTPAAAGLTLTTWRYTPPTSIAPNSNLTRARRDGQSLAAHHHDIRPAGLDLRQDRNIDVERLPDAWPLSQFKFELHRQLGFALARRFHHAAGLLRGARPLLHGRGATTTRPPARAAADRSHDGRRSRAATAQAIRTLPVFVIRP